MNLLDEQEEEQEELLLPLGERRPTSSKGFQLQQKEEEWTASLPEEMGLGKAAWSTKRAVYENLEWSRVRETGQKESHGQSRLGDIASRLVETAVWVAGREGETFPIGTGVASSVIGKENFVEMENGAQTLPTLYQSLRQGRLRTLEDESRRMTVELAEYQTSGTGVDVKTLDRIFQRDARRYDGGLTLL